MFNAHQSFKALFLSTVQLLIKGPQRGQACAIRIGALARIPFHPGQMVRKIARHWHITRALALPLFRLRSTGRWRWHRRAKHRFQRRTLFRSQPDEQSHVCTAPRHHLGSIRHPGRI
jgi:hypothetical protein